jgi:hypothetical protein
MTKRMRRSDRSGRVPLRSPGRPCVAGPDQRRRFWSGISAGLSSEEAAEAAGFPPAIGARWFRNGAGMPPAIYEPAAKPLSGRLLSFAEREEIALLRALGCSMRMIAGQLGRVPSTISRELRRNAACRAAPEACEARAERGAARLRAGAVCRRGRRFRQSCCSRREGGVERSSPWLATGSAMGARLEPGTDRPSSADRFSGR